MMMPLDQPYLSNDAMENGYLSKNQVDVVLARKNDGLTYEH